MIDKSASWPAWMPAPTAHDFPEDAEDNDNGCYGHRCVSCGHEFVGHKRRPPTCKVCAAIGQARWDALTPEEQAKETAELNAYIKQITEER